MTEQEKARAYDEALERFKSFKEKYYKSDTDFGDVIFDKTGEMQKAFNSIFPELKESEDERITRAINNMLPFIPDEAYANNGVTKEDVLSWLEKQKKQKPVQTADEKEYIRIIKSLIADFIRDKKPEDVAYYQKIYDWLDGISSEQKPAPISCGHEKGTPAEVCYGPKGDPDPADTPEYEYIRKDAILGWIQEARAVPHENAIVRDLAFQEVINKLNSM